MRHIFPPFFRLNTKSAINFHFLPQSFFAPPVDSADFIARILRRSSWWMKPRKTLTIKGFFLWNVRFLEKIKFWWKPLWKKKYSCKKLSCFFFLTKKKDAQDTFQISLSQAGKLNLFFGWFREYCNFEIFWRESQLLENRKKDCF